MATKPAAIPEVGANDCNGMSWQTDIPAGRVRAPIWIYDLDRFCMVWANAAGLRFWRAESLGALRARDFAPQSQSSRQRLVDYNRILADGASIEEVWTFYPLGQARTERVALSLWPLDGGRPGLMVEVVGNDAAPLSPADLRSLESFRQSTALTLMVALDGRILLCNPAASATLPQLAAPSARLSDVLVNPAEAEDLIARTSRAGSQTEVALRCGDRHAWFLANLRLTLDPVSGDACAVINLTDLSELRQLQQRADHSNASLRDALEAAPVPIIIISLIGERLLFANTVAMTAFATTPERIADDALTLVTLNRETIAQARSALATVTRYGPIEIRAHLTPDHSRAMMLTGRLIEFDSEPAMILSVLDVEELHVTEQRLSEALDRERELNRVQQQLVSVVSHELRTPLAVIDSAVQRLRRHARVWSEDEIDNRLEQLRYKVQKLSKLSESLLDAARLDEGRIPFRPTAIKLDEWLGRIVQQQQELATANPIFLQRGLLPEEFFGDPQLLEQILVNLIGNAVKYSPHGTPVSVDARIVEQRLRLTISDQGLGIPLAEQSQVFERFFRASTTLAIHGTGLGLYICRQMAELHGGTIDLQSVPGLGTRVTVELPLAHALD